MFLSLIFEIVLLYFKKKFIFHISYFLIEGSDSVILKILTHISHFIFHKKNATQNGLHLLSSIETTMALKRFLFQLLHSLLR